MNALIKASDGEALLKSFRVAKQARDDYVDGLS